MRTILPIIKGKKREDIDSEDDSYIDKRYNDAEVIETSSLDEDYPEIDDREEDMDPQGEDSRQANRNKSN